MNFVTQAHNRHFACNERLSPLASITQMLPFFA